MRWLQRQPKDTAQLAMLAMQQITPFSATKSLEDIDLLAKSSVLAHLNVKELSTFIDVLDQLVFTPGTTILREGDEGEHMFFILEGQARARRGSLDVARLGPGDHFGETAILGVRMHAMTVQADTVVRLARMSRSRFLSLATNHPRVALHVVEALATTLASSLTAMTDDVGLLLRQRTLPRRSTVRVLVGGQVVDIAMGSAVATVLPVSGGVGAASAGGGALVVAAAVDHKPVSLDTPITSDARIDPITLASWEGRRIYRTSAGILLLEAARRAFPGVDASLGACSGDGQVVRLTMTTTASREEVATAAARLEQELRDLIAANTPLREELWTVEEARVRMEEQGWADAAALLPFHRDKTITLVSCGKTFALSFGPVMLHARDLAGLSVQPSNADSSSIATSPNGSSTVELTLRFGPRLAARDGGTNDAAAPSFLAGEMSEQLQTWLDVMGVTSVGRFDRSCVTGQVNELIRISEGFHEKNIGLIADRIAAAKRSKSAGSTKSDNSFVVAIAGPSSSGKTTFIKRLKVQLEVNGILPIHLSLDDYYVDRERTPRDEQGEWDFEALEAIDLRLFGEHAHKLLRKRERIRSPRYDFKSGLSIRDDNDNANAAHGHELSLEDSRSVLLVEGLHALNPRILASCGDARGDSFRIFVHPRTTLPFDRLSSVLPEDVRLIRRIVRDRHQRGYSASESIARWPSVRRGEERNVFTCVKEADFVFDSSLVYELAVLRVYAERYLLEIADSDPSYMTGYRLRQLIDRFVPIHPDHVPPTSILREFIGGSGFDL